MRNVKYNVSLLEDTFTYFICLEDFNTMSLQYIDVTNVKSSKKNWVHVFKSNIVSTPVFANLDI